MAIARRGCSPSGESAWLGNRNATIAPPAKMNAANRNAHWGLVVATIPAPIVPNVNPANVPASDTRALARTSVLVSGRSRGITALRETPYALDRTRIANAPG